MTLRMLFFETFNFVFKPKKLDPKEKDSSFKMCCF